MKSFALLAALPAAVWAAAYSQADYDSGRVHNMVMQSKEVRHGIISLRPAARDMLTTC